MKKKIKRGKAASAAKKPRKTFRPRPAGAAKDAAPESMNAIDILKADHKRVKGIFRKYRQMADGNGGDYRQKRAMVEEACRALEVHARVEEELVYPLLRDVLSEQNLVDEAEVEHDCAKALIRQIQHMDPRDDYYDAKFIVLGEQVKHHIKEEEEKIFPVLRKTKVDLQRLGDSILSLRRNLEDGRRVPGGYAEDRHEGQDFPARVAYPLR